MRKLPRSLRLVLWGLLGVFALIQFVPYGRDHGNPPVTEEPRWVNAQARAVVATSCFDCHSNETRWPWYSNIAPMSWLTQWDVDLGREALNFSEWDRPQEGEDLYETVLEGGMPPWNYLLLHPDARLSQEERVQLIEWLRATLRNSPIGEGGEDSGGQDGDGESNEQEGGDE